MALFKHLGVSENENVHKLLPSKQFGANSSQSVKKKALQDVKNTIHTSIQRPSKPFGSTIKPQSKGKSLFSEVKSTKKNPTKQKDGNHTLSLRKAIGDISDLNEENIEPVCNCNKYEEDYEEFMFKNIRLSKKQIEDIALIWENPPTYGIDDIRKVDPKSLEIPEPENFGFDWDPVFDHVPEINLGDTEVPPAYFEMSNHDDSLDCCIGL